VRGRFGAAIDGAGAAARVRDDRAAVAPTPFFFTVVFAVVFTRFFALFFDDLRSGRVMPFLRRGIAAFFATLRAAFFVDCRGVFFAFFAFFAMDRSSIRSFDRLLGLGRHSARGTGAGVAGGGASGFFGGLSRSLSQPGTISPDATSTIASAKAPQRCEVVCVIVSPFLADPATSEDSPHLRVTRTQNPHAVAWLY
jgi:hypothetical protein